MTVHELAASPGHVHWGYFDAALPPVLEVDSGDKVRLTSVSGGPEVTPKEGFFVPQALRDIHASVRQKLQGHILTGPVAVRGAAKPGHVLEVRLHDIELVQDWGYNAIRPLSAEDAYTLCSLAADLRVTQIVNHHKGVHMMLEKSLLRSP